MLKYPWLETSGLLGKAHLLLEEQEGQLKEVVEDSGIQENQPLAAPSLRVEADLSS